MPGWTSATSSLIRPMPGIFSPSSRVGIVSTSFESDERLLRVGLHDLRVDHLAGDVREGGHVDAVAGLQQIDAAALSRVHLTDPLAGSSVSLGQLADAEVLGLQMRPLQRLGKMPARSSPGRLARTCASVHDT